MKHLSKLTLIFILGSIGLFGQVTWIKTYGGPNDDYGNSIQQTSDGGYITAGETKSYGAGAIDVYLIKTDSLGDTTWTKTYAGNDYNFGESVQQTSDGGYIIAGRTGSASAPSYDVYLIKTNSNGDTTWTKTYGDVFADFGYSVQQTADGGYIVTGRTYPPFGAGGSDVYLIKTDSIGDTLWTKIYGGADDDFGLSVQQTADGGYIVTGGTGSNGVDTYLIKTNSLGDTLWTRTYGGIYSDYGISVQQTADGGYIVAGTTRSYGQGGNDVYLIKTDSIGDTLWTETYGGADDDYGNSVQQTADGGYIVAGKTGSDTGSPSYDIYLIKTNSSGDTIGTKTYGGADYDCGNSVQQTADGGYIIAGETKSYGAGGSDVYLIKVNSELSGIEEEINTDLFSLSPADPNPFTIKTTFSYKLKKAVNVNISVYNMLGQKIKNLHSGKKSSGAHEVTWNGTGNSEEKLSSGIYFLRIEAGNKEASRKVMFMR